MSRHLLAPSQIKQRVLIAGNGHVRRDYGVPNHMEKSTVSIGIEVRPSKINPLTTVLADTITLVHPAARQFESMCKIPKGPRSNATATPSENQ